MIKTRIIDDPRWHALIQRRDARYKASRETFETARRAMMAEQSAAQAEFEEAERALVQDRAAGL